MAAEVPNQNVAAQFLTELALILKVFQQEHVPIKGFAILHLVPFEGGLHLQEIPQGPTVAVEVQVF